MRRLVLYALLAVCSPISAQEARVKVTYYTLRGRTASGERARKGVCAVSPDLERKGFTLGKRVRVDGYGEYLIADRTSKRMRNTLDLWGERRNGKNVKVKVI